MATWYVNYTMKDDASPKAGVRTKRFKGDFADYAAVTVAEADLRTDLIAATGAAIVRIQLTEDIVIAASPSAGSNVFEVASVTVPLSPIKSANFALPAPVPALQGAGNNVDTSNAAWTDLIDNFTAAAGWEVSDGEHVDTSIGYGDGKLIMVRSGARFS